MTCADAADLIESVAAGELAPDASLSAHLAGCPACAQSVQTARQIDGLLRARPVPSAPSQFTSHVVARLHRATWRREQIVDAVFNSLMIAAALIVAAGFWIALQRSGVSLVNRDAVDIFSAGMLTAAQKVAPSLPLYAGATGLIVAALGLWWWASDSAAL
jgi:anti-sigma factor RsiW